MRTAPTPPYMKRDSGIQHTEVRIYNSKRYLSPVHFYEDAITATEVDGSGNAIVLSKVDWEKLPFAPKA